MDAALKATLTDRVTLEAFAGENREGGFVVGAAQADVPARWEPGTRQVLEEDGSITSGKGTLWLDAADVATLPVKSVVTLPDGTKAVVVQVETLKEIDGAPAHHEAVLR